MFLSQVLYVCVYYFRETRRIKKSKNMKIKLFRSSASDEDRVGGRTYPRV